jgi:hypothetical protein
MGSINLSSSSAVPLTDGGCVTTARDERPAAIFGRRPTEPRDHHAVVVADRFAAAPDQLAGREVIQTGLQPADRKGIQATVHGPHGRSLCHVGTDIMSLLSVSPRGQSVSQTNGGSIEAIFVKNVCQYSLTE